MCTLTLQMLASNDWKQVNDELHDFLTHLRRLSYLVSSTTGETEFIIDRYNTLGSVNREASIDRRATLPTKSVMNKKIIHKFLHSLHWIQAEMGPINEQLDDAKVHHQKSKALDAKTAYAHVHVVTYFTILSCLNYLKLALERLEKNENELNGHANNKSDNESVEYVIPKFDCLLQSAQLANEYNQWNNKDLGYDLTSTNITKVLYLQIRELLNSLVVMAMRRYMQTENVLDALRSPSSIFECGCIQDLFIAVHHIVKKLHPNQFWTLLENAMKISEHSFNNIETRNNQQLHRFLWVFLSHLFPCVISYDALEETLNEKNQDRSKIVKTQVFDESKEVLISTLRNTLKYLDETFSEQTLRNSILALIQISNSLKVIDNHYNDEGGIANVIALSMLWDFFLKKLNNQFKGGIAISLETSTQAVLSLTILASSHDAWINTVEDTILQDKNYNDATYKEARVNSNPNTTDLNTYYLYIRLIGIQLDPFIKDVLSSNLVQLNTKTTKAVKQFVGRVRSKLTASKIHSLEEIGLHHLFTLFIALIISQKGDNQYNYAAIAAIAEAVYNIAKEEVKHYNTNAIPPKKLVTYLRGLGSILVLLLKALSFKGRTIYSDTMPEDVVKERSKVVDLVGLFVEVIAERVEIAVNVSSSQTIGLDKISFSAADNAIRVYADLLQDSTCLNSTSYFLCQKSLIQAGLGKYFLQKIKQNSGIAEVKNVLLSLIAITTKLRKYYNSINRNSAMSLSVEQRKTKEGIDNTCLNLWKNVYPVIKTSLCTYSIGVSGGLSCNVANQVAEFIVAMSLLSQTLSSAQSPPTSSTTNPMESFSDMFKYFSQSPVVHPSITTAFLLNVVQSDIQTETDETQQSLLFKGWIRCTTLLSPSDETLKLLSVQILQHEKDFLYETSDHATFDGLAIYVEGISKFHIGSDFCQTLRKKYDPIFDSYIDCINRNFQQTANNGSQSALHRLYAVGGLIVKNCTRLLYVEKMANKLQPILQRLFTSSAMLKEDFIMTNHMKFAMSCTLPDFIQGMSTVQQLENDQFVLRNLKYIYVTYLHRFEVNDKHPFIRAFKQDKKDSVQSQKNTSGNYPMQCFVNYKGMYQQFFYAIRSEFLSKQPNYRQRLKLKHTLDFVILLIRLLPGISFYAAQSIMYVILDIRLTVAVDDVGVKNVAAELISELVKNGNSGALEDQSRSELRTVILKEVEKIINSHLAFYVEETFQLLMALSTLDRNLVNILLPDIEQTVAEIEVKRGITSSEGGMFQKRLNGLRKRVKYD